MARIVPTADCTLMTAFREGPLTTFFSRIPTDSWVPRLAFRILALPPADGGEPVVAPRGLWKIEPSLPNDGFAREDVAVAVPNHVREFPGWTRKRSASARRTRWAWAPRACRSRTAAR